MNIVAVLVVGLLSGYVASQIVETRGFGAIGDLCLGVFGATVAGFLFSSFGGMNSLLGSLLTSAVGAVVLLSLAHVFREPGRLAKQVKRSYDHAA